MLSFLILFASSCTFEEVEGELEDVTNETEGRIEVNTESMIGIWEIEYYKVGFLEIDPENAPLRYIGLYDSTFNDLNLGGNLFLDDETGNPQYGATLWDIEGNEPNESLIQYDSHMESERQFKIIHLTADRLVLGEGDDIKAYFTRRNNLDEDKLKTLQK